MDNIYEIKPGVFALEDGHVRMYLVCGRDKAVLLDSGYGSPSLIHDLAKLYSGKIQFCLTHAHGDHSGGANLFDIAFCGEADAAALKEQGFKGEISVLKTGDIIELGGRKLEVIAKPGHTPGSLLFLDRENRLIFTGDYISDVPIWEGLPESDLKEYVHTLKWIIENSDLYDCILGCHGTTPQSVDTAKKLSNLAEKVLSGEVVPQEKEGLPPIIRAIAEADGVSIYCK